MYEHFALFIDDAYIHFTSVQIDTAIVFVLFVIKSHGVASFGLRVNEIVGISIITP
jgi:hypothetical protein